MVTLLHVSGPVMTYIVCHDKCVGLVAEGLAEQSSSHHGNLKEEGGMEKRGGKGRRRERGREGREVQAGGREEEVLRTRYVL